MLSSQHIAVLGGAAASQVDIRIVEKTGSTNADLLAGLDSLSFPTLLIAEVQTAGRGRAGRVWHSAGGASLTFSLAWKFDRPLLALVGLPLAVGVVLAEVLASFDVEVQLKWPNDILHKEKKLAGILIETAAAKGGHVHDATWAVIGIGLNINVPQQLAVQIGRPVADLAQKEALDRNVLMGAILNALVEALVLFEAQGFTAYMTRWNRLHAYAGRRVTVLDHGQTAYEGTAIGVDEAGRFLLDTTVGRIAVMAGDVSLRVQEG